MIEQKTIYMRRNYRVTEQTIKSRPNLYVEVWHVVGSYPFHVTLQQNGQEVAMSEETNWEHVIQTCKLLNRWGISKDRFFVRGSTNYKDVDLQNELGAKESKTQ